jgi:hypothetical protein
MSKKVPNHFEVQLDVIAVGDSQVICNLYTGERCVKIAMLKNDYEGLLVDRFFIRDGKQRDSANVLNTTLTYSTKEKVTS